MRLVILAFLCSLALPAAAQTGISAEIGRSGLAATEVRLAALPAPSDSERFALGGVRFLATVERALQLRWRAGLTDRMGMVPFLRLPLVENRTPEPFRPAMIADLFRDVTLGMDRARQPLSKIAEGSDLAVDIALSDLWFDVNGNALRDPGEELLDVAGPIILGWRWRARAPDAPAPVIRFDAADAAWLSAYTHLLAGIAEVILAYDPTEAITGTLAATAALDRMRVGPADPHSMESSMGEAVDVVAIMLAALDQTPDGARAASAQGHFLSMIADNRRFWTLVETETDNANEWLPNDRQTSALGIHVPPGTGPAWQAVLADGEALLQGEKLAPYWRVGPGHGVNIGRLFTDPRPVDVIGWIQGAAALPYLERGTVVSDASWRRFSNLVSGEAMLFSVFLN